MGEVHIRTEGMAGRITLTRPKALNALTYDMCRAIDAALIAWEGDPRITRVILDSAGDKAFCAGGDIAELYARGRAGDFAYGQGFWRDEYRMNARIHAYPKPVVSFLQGFTMGGGVGLGCHGSHRIVGETARISMPEVAIGLIPDVGGSYLLAQAPGHLGAYLALTTHRMTAGDAVYAGFADLMIPEAQWEDLKSDLCRGADLDRLADHAVPDPTSGLHALQVAIDAVFSAGSLSALVTSLSARDEPFATEARDRIARHAPLAMAATLALLQGHRRDATDMRAALRAEYRYTARAQDQGDFLEGIRALIVDKDKSPRWHHSHSPLPTAQLARDVAFMLGDLGGQELTF